MKKFKLENEPKIESGFTVPDHYFDDFSELLVYDYLIKNYSIHNNWLLFCEDKRVNESWTIEKNFFFYNVYFLNKRVWQGWAADGHQLIAIGFKRTNNCIGIRRNRGIGAKVITARGISLVVATDAICLHNGHNVV